MDGWMDGWMHTVWQLCVRICAARCHGHSPLIVSDIRQDGSLAHRQRIKRAFRASLFSGSKVFHAESWESVAASQHAYQATEEKATMRRLQENLNLTTDLSIWAKHLQLRIVKTYVKIGFRAYYAIMSVRTLKSMFGSGRAHGVKDGS
eukprot:6431474-Amphidinium_carterae.1